MLEAVGEGGVAATGAGRPDRDGEGFAAADQHDQAFGPGDGGVEQVALQQGEALMVSGTTTTGYSLPCKRCTVMA